MFYDGETKGLLNIMNATYQRTFQDQKQISKLFTFLASSYLSFLYDDRNNGLVF